jgi:hypothetical protein
MEVWNIGKLGNEVRLLNPNIPSFQYSVIPIFQYFLIPSSPYSFQRGGLFFIVQSSLCPLQPADFFKKFNILP